MPVTRSEGRGRKPSGEQKPSSTETRSSPTGNSAEASTEESTETGTSATETSERTDTSAATDPSTVTSATDATTSTAATAATSATTSAASHPATAVAPSVTPSAATTLTAEAKAKLLMKPPATVNKESYQETETATVKQVMRSNAGLQDLRPPSKKEGKGGSTHSRTKQLKLAKAKEDLLRLQVELAAARLAALEKEDSEEEEDDVTLYSKSEVNERVGDWLEQQQVTRPVLTIADEPHKPPEEPMVVRIEKPRPAKHEETRQSPAGGQTDMALLAEAITRAISITQRPKFVELPFFSGSHQE